MTILGWILFGLVIGVLAKLVMPGRDPGGIIVTILLGIAGALLGRVQARFILAGGLALTGVGLLLMGGLSAGSEWTALLLGFLVAGTGVGLLNPAIADVALSVVPKEQSGMASGINDTFRQVGIAVGIATWGALFVGHGASRVTELAAGTPAAGGERPRQLIEAASSGNLGAALDGVPDGARATVAHATREGFLAGMNEILMLGALVALAGGILALLLVHEHQIERESLVGETDLALEGAQA